MKMVNKHGNVVMDIKSKTEQERLKGLGYTEYTPRHDSPTEVEKKATTAKK